MSETPSAPPGWYPAGVPGEERWWDGTQWTPHARPAAHPPQPGVAQAAASPGFAQPAASPSRLQPPLWGNGHPAASIVAGVFCGVVAVVVLLLSFSFFAGGHGVQGVLLLVFTLGLLALAVTMFINASVGIRVRRERQQASAHPDGSH